MDIMGDLIEQVGTGENLTALSSTLGGDEKSVQSALGLALPMVMGSMAKTAAKPGGADLITSMMAQVGGGVATDSMASYLSTPAPSGGSDIVSQLLGGQMGAIQNAISQKTGLPPAIVGTLLAVVTPMILGAVKNKFTDKKMDSAGLTSLLGDQAKVAMQSSPDATALADQFLGAEEETAGILGSIKKIFGM